MAYDFACCQKCGAVIGLIGRLCQLLHIRSHTCATHTSNPLSFSSTQNSAGRHIYMCPNGHVFDVQDGTWTTLTIQFWGSSPRTKHYNYCMECFGEWAEKKWPLVGGKG